MASNTRPHAMRSGRKKLCNMAGLKLTEHTQRSPDAKVPGPVKADTRQVSASAPPLPGVVCFGQANLVSASSSYSDESERSHHRRHRDPEAAAEG